jgi:hypothetical protein
VPLVKLGKIKGTRIAGATCLVVLVFCFLWIATDDKPNQAYLELSKPAARTLDATNNGYFLLLGFGAPTEEDPLLAGHQMWQAFQAQRQDHNDWRFDYDTKRRSTRRFSKELHALGEWLDNPHPVTEFLKERTMLQAWTDEYAVLMRRYEKFLSMPFEEWADYHPLHPYPDFSYPVTAHRLYIAAGFADGIRTGMDRLEKDLSAWRNILANAATLLTKKIAARLVSEDVRIIQDLQTLDPGAPQKAGRFNNLLKPLTPAERSLRWPFQTEFLTWAALWRYLASSEKEIDKTEASRLWNMMKALAKENPETHVNPERLRSAIIIVPFQIQRTLNTLARYYEASIGATDTYANFLPKAASYGMTPPKNYYDFLFNPIGKILLGAHGDPRWGIFLKEVQKADALLRLSSLRRLLETTSPQGDEQLSKVVLEKGESYYDPYTNKPMLWNQKKRMLYSVGQNNQDDDGDGTLDIVVQLQ